MIDEKKAEENIKNFMKKHGIKGFLVLYFCNYIYELLIFQLKTKLLDADPDRDPAYIFFTKSGKITTPSDVDEYHKELYDTCMEKAKLIVDELEKDENFSSLLEGNLSKIGDQVLEKKIEKSLHAIFESLREVDNNDSGEFHK